MSPHRATSEFPFSLVYEMEDVIPAEIKVPSLRRESSWQNEPMNDERLKDELDFIEERCELAQSHVKGYQRATPWYYNSKFRERRYLEGKIVLRRMFQNTTEPNSGKLSTN